MLDACDRLLLLVTDSTSGAGGMLLLVFVLLMVLMSLEGCIPFLVQIICVFLWLMVDSGVYACFCVVCELYFVLVLLF
jgi:hypothetical protein